MDCSQLGKWSETNQSTEKILLKHDQSKKDFLFVYDLDLDFKYGATDWKRIIMSLYQTLLDQIWVDELKLMINSNKLKKL